MNKLTLCIVFVLSAATGQAEPVQWPIAEGGNGHYYEAKIGYGHLFWELSAMAQQLSYGGFTGHLATITSAAEDLWIVTNVPVPAPPARSILSIWLGGWNSTEVGNDGGLEGWRWITGEPWSYENWSIGEPSLPEVEWLLSYHYYYDFRLGFNDVGPGFRSLAWYLVEYDEFSVVSMPPEQAVATETQTWGSVKALFR